MDETDCMHNITVQYCFPYMNSSCRKEVQTGPAYIFLFIVLLCVSVCTVFLNLLVIISISHFKQLHTPTNLLILSLAVADLLVGLIVMPVNVIGFIDSCWYFGKMGCIIFPLITFISMSASLCSLIFIAVDQYIAVCDPLLYSTRVTVCRTSLLIILGWSLCLLYVTMYLYFNDHFLQSQISTRCDGECILVQKYSWVIIDLVFSFLTPCSIILVMYSIIFNTARRQAKAVRAVVNAASHKHGVKVASSSDTKAAKKLGTVVFVYLACWIPFYITSLSGESVTSLSIVWTVFGWLQLINSSMNPLMYAIFYSWFRASTKYIVTGRIFENSSSRFHLFPENF
ncbi:trace amine-associated receptor 13c-like [Pygocentrus nattereri]|uniref:trace amine-associated receptor 13c-like n=1 Tax=Pygocentrus nattereri TaxID=42514 RepID=UPI0008145D6C|nr:trace amine-associated receptor 13c-like [Pygocentrus nattereri]